MTDSPDPRPTKCPDCESDSRPAWNGCVNQFHKLDEPVERERQEFEKWAKDLSFDITRDYGGYLERDVRWMWEAWQARAKGEQTCKE